MNHQSIQQEFPVLPPDAQREVIDFIEFLKTRYVKKTESTSKKMITAPIEEEIFIGMWRNRKDLENSSEWVKQTRRMIGSNKWEI